MAEVFMDIRSSNLDTVHAVEMVLLKDSEMICENPLCDVRFPQTGMAISPKRFCCDKCKQQASLIKRAAALLVPLGKERAWEIIFESMRETVIEVAEVVDEVSQAMRKEI